MRVKYTAPKASEYLQHYRRQTGAGGEFFKGPRFQRGSGIGSFFSSIGRFILPFLRPAASALGKQALRTGSQLLADATSGQDMKQAAKTRFREAGANLLTRAGEALQRGSGIKRKRPAKKHTRAKKICRVKDIFTQRV